MQETTSKRYPQQTERNVKDSDGSVIWCGQADGKRASPVKVLVAEVLAEPNLPQVRSV